MDLATVGKRTRLGQRVAEGKMSASLCLACSLEDQALNLKLHVLISTGFLSGIPFAKPRSYVDRLAGPFIQATFYLKIQIFINNKWKKQIKKENK